MSLSGCDVFLKGSQSRIALASVFLKKMGGPFLPTVEDRIHINDDECGIVSADSSKRVIQDAQSGPNLASCHPGAVDRAAIGGHDGDGVASP